MKTITQKRYNAVFAQTEFSTAGEIDQFEFARLILRLSGLGKLISANKISQLMGYKHVYARKVSLRNCLYISVTEYAN